jgi:hypothetical protein
MYITICWMFHSIPSIAYYSFATAYREKPNLLRYLVVHLNVEQMKKKKNINQNGNKRETVIRNI